jgi:RNA polymerase sigma factor (sigma-70 family)
LIETEIDIITLIEGCLQNNLKAQEQLYKNYYRSMMSLCMRYTKNEQNALEVLNIGFFKAFKNLKSYDNTKATFYTWLRTIIINSCIDFNKVIYFEVNTIEQAADVEELPVIFSKLGVNEIVEKIRMLPNATQTVFNLYAIEGYNHNEISKLLGISVGTSKWHYSEAKKKLQQLLNAEIKK